MSSTDRLYPPNIEGTIPAFTNNILSVPFSMNRTVSYNEIKSLWLKIKTVQSNVYLYTAECPKENCLWDPAKIAYFTLPDEAMSLFNIGQSYKVQLAYEDTSGVVGYYSTVGVVKYTTDPEVEIEGMEHGKINGHEYDYVGHYSQLDGDTTEKVYSYKFDLYDRSGAIIETSGEQFHNSSEDIEKYESIDRWNLPRELDINTSYYLQYTIKTTSGLIKSSPKYRLMQKKSIDAEIKADLIATLDYENGYVDLFLKGQKNDMGVEYTASGSFKVLRADSESNFGTWNEILRFALYGQMPSQWLWKDQTVKQGVKYKYALQQYNDNNLHSNKIESAEILVDFEHAFLYDGKRQLKIKYNPKVASFTNTILEAKLDTIGSKYPFIFRNGNVNYKTFPISGLISYLSDEQELFFDFEDIKKLKRDKTPSGQEDKNFYGNTNLTSKNIKLERDFKLEVLEWLTNGEPKLFRSPTEGNYIVRLLNTSLTPTDTVGRMIHSFNCNAYEIAESSYNNLSKYGIIKVTDPTEKQYLWTTVELDKAATANNQNLIQHSQGANSLRFEGMIPGDRIIMIDSEGKTIDTVIGVTGSYLLELQNGITINTVYFPEDSFDSINNPSGYVNHQGTLTYSYFSKMTNVFNTITDVDIEEVPLHQFTGDFNYHKDKESDIIPEITDIKNILQNIYFIHCLARQQLTAYADTFNSEEIYNSTTMNETTLINGNYDPYVFYEVNVIGANKLAESKYYYDAYNKKIIERELNPWVEKLDNLKVGDLISNGAYNELRIINPAVFRVLERQEDGNWKYVGSNEINIVELFRYSDLIHLPLEMYWIQLDDSQMDIYEKQEYVFKAPKLKKFLISDGVMAEISYQKQTLTYSFEDNIPEDIRIALEEAEAELDKMFDNVEDYTKEEILQARANYEVAYDNYIKATEEAQADYLEAQGDVAK